MTGEEIKELIDKITRDMKQAAADLQFERAAELRDILMELKKK
jgi:excinuclease ABC subunit B